MIVVADTSPVNYPVLIGRVDVLERIYGRVILPAAVLEELTSPGAPERVRAWVRDLPEWLEASGFESGDDFSVSHLDRGERHMPSRWRKISAQCA